jgi:Tol biopolymer transport system component
LVPSDGSTSGETVGPQPARCTNAGWSPDGRVMYFSADAGDGYHIWRQHFLVGTPEQLTFGATEEEGIAVSPDGRTLVTCAGIRESTVWLHDARGDRQISGEGFASLPGLGFVGAGTHSVFSPDGKRLFYLIRKQGSRAYKSGELRVTDLDSGQTEPVLPGVLMSEFEIAPDGDRVAFAALDAEGNSHVYLAPLDGATPPKQLSSSVARQPGFGPGGDVYFLLHEGDQEFLYSVGPNEIVPRKIDPEPSSEYEHVSPHGDWRLLGGDPGNAIADPTPGGTPIRICSHCEAGWGPGGRFLYIRFRENGEMAGGKTIVIGLTGGKEVPHLPPSGVKPTDDLKGLNVVAEIDMKGIAIFAPGPNPSVYAYSRMTVQRNLFRIPLK